MIGNILSSDYLQESNRVAFNVKRDLGERDLYTESMEFLIDSDRLFAEEKIAVYKRAALSENAEEVIHEGVIEATKNLFKRLIDFIKGLFNKTKSTFNNEFNKFKKFERIMKTEANRKKIIKIKGYEKYNSPLAIITSFDKNMSDQEILNKYLTVFRCGKTQPTEFELDYTKGKEYVKFFDSFGIFDIDKTRDDIIKKIKIKENELISKGTTVEEAEKESKEMQRIELPLCTAFNTILKEYAKTVDQYLDKLKSNKKDEED